LVPAYGKLGR